VSECQKILVAVNISAQQLVSAQRKNILLGMTIPPALPAYANERKSALKF
jgi:hypothetical protein